MSVQLPPPPSGSCCVANLNTHTLLANLIEECKVLKQIYQHYLCVCVSPPSLFTLFLSFFSSDTLQQYFAFIICIVRQRERVDRTSERMNQRPTTQTSFEKLSTDVRPSTLTPLILSTSLPTLFLPPLFHLEARALHHKQPQTSANPKRILLSL